MGKWRLSALVLAAVGSIAIAGCQSSRPAAVATAPSGVALPTALPADAVQLTGEQIQVAFSGIREDYVAIGNAGVTATGTWSPDGKMSATWVSGSATGDVAGDWYVDGDMRCIKFTSGMSAGTLECTTVYAYGDGYLSAHPDGSLNGYHINTPL